MIRLQYTQISKISLMRAEKNIRYVTIYKYHPRPSSNHFVRTMHQEMETYERQVAGSMHRLQSAFIRNSNSVAQQRCHPRWRTSESSDHPIASHTHFSTHHIQHYRQSDRLAIHPTNVVVNQGNGPAQRHKMTQTNRCPSCSKKLVHQKRSEEKAKKKDEVHFSQGTNPALSLANLQIQPSEKKKKKSKPPKKIQKDKSNKPNPTKDNEQQQKEPNPPEQEEITPTIRNEQEKKEPNQDFRQGQLREYQRSFANQEQEYLENYKSSQQENLLKKFQETQAENEHLRRQNIQLKNKIQNLKKMRQQASSAKKETQRQVPQTIDQILFSFLNNTSPYKHSSPQKGEKYERQRQMSNEIIKKSPSLAEEKSQICASSEYKKKKNDYMNRFREQCEREDLQGHIELEQHTFNDIHVSERSNLKGTDSFLENRGLRIEKSQSQQEQLLSLSSRKSPNNLSSSRRSTKPIIIMIPGEDQHYRLLLRIALENQEKIRRKDIPQE